MPDNSEIVDEGEVCLTVLERGLERFLRYSCRLVLIASDLTDATNSLRLEVEFATDVVAINRKRDERM